MDITPENVASRIEALRRASGRFDILDCETALQVADLAAALSAERDALAAKLAEWQALQHYAYIGRGGKPVLARDLEARAEAEAARVAELTAENERLRESIPSIALDAQLRCMEGGRLDAPDELYALKGDKP